VTIEQEAMLKVMKEMGSNMQTTMQEMGSNMQTTMHNVVTVVQVFKNETTQANASLKNEMVQTQNSFKNEMVQAQASFQDETTQANASLKDDVSMAVDVAQVAQLAVVEHKIFNAVAAGANVLSKKVNAVLRIRDLESEQKQTDVRKMCERLDNMQKELDHMKKLRVQGTTSVPVAKPVKWSSASGGSGSKRQHVQHTLPPQKRPHVVGSLVPEADTWKKMVKHAPNDTFVWTSDIVDLLKTEFGVNLASSKHVAAHYGTVNDLMDEHYNVKPMSISEKDGNGKPRTKMGFRGFAVNVPTACALDAVTTRSEIAHLAERK
jgi:hypothetical protein